MDLNIIFNAHFKQQKKLAQIAEGLYAVFEDFRRSEFGSKVTDPEDNLMSVELAKRFGGCVLQYGYQDSDQQLILYVEANGQIDMDSGETYFTTEFSMHDEPEQTIGRVIHIVKQRASPANPIVIAFGKYMASKQPQWIKEA